MSPRAPVPHVTRARPTDKGVRGFFDRVFAAVMWPLALVGAFATLVASRAMMARPGVEVYSRTSKPSRGAPSDTGVWYVAGITEKGPTDTAYEIKNMSDYTRIFGARVAYGLLYDALDVFFNEGGTKAYVSRVVGPAAAVDTLVRNDVGAAPSIAIDSWGQYDSNLTVQVVAGATAGTFVLVIFDNAVEVERSYDLADPAAAVIWSTKSNYVRVRALGANDPAVAAAVALAGGTDDRAAIVDAQKITGIARFPRALGPGQVSYPGATTVAIHEALLEHAQANARVAILDAPDSASNATLAAAADAIRAAATLNNEGEAFGGLFAPWAVVPGITRGTTRTVPYSAVVAGEIARSDGVTGNVNLPAAGSNGESRYAVGLSQPAWADATREALNASGVNVAVLVYGAVRTYGWRTLVDPNGPDAGWLEFSAARTRMAITNEANALGEAFLFAQLDGKGQKVAEFGGAVAGVLKRYWGLGALYGASADEAYSVDVGPTVNTPERIANRELRAAVGIRTSPFAELAVFEIVKVPVTESL